MECHVSAGGLGSYLRRYWRELVLHRHRIPLEGENPYAVKIHVRRKAQCGVACQI